MTHVDACGRLFFDKHSSWGPGKMLGSGIFVAVPSSRSWTCTEQDSGDGMLSVQQIAYQTRTLQLKPDDQWPFASWDA